MRFLTFIVLGCVIAGSFWAGVAYYVSPFFKGVVAEQRVREAVVCREGFVKIERHRQMPACVAGYEP